MSPSGSVTVMDWSSTEVIEARVSSASSVVMAGAISSIGCSTEKSERVAACAVTVSTSSVGSTPSPGVASETDHSSASSS